MFKYLKFYYYNESLINDHGKIARQNFDQIVWLIEKIKCQKHKHKKKTALTNNENVSRKQSNRMIKQ